MVEKRQKKVEVDIHNRFDIEVVDATTGEIKQRAQAKNIICNSAWSNMFSGVAADNIIFGSGTGTPSVSDTDMFHREGVISAQSSYGDFENIDTSEAESGIYKRILRRTLRESDAVGISITEVGLGPYSGNIHTHAMLQDMNGNTISILKTNTDIIRIISTLYIHFDPDNDVQMMPGYDPSVRSASSSPWNFLWNLLKFSFKFSYPSSGLQTYLSKDRYYATSITSTNSTASFTADVSQKKATLAKIRFDSSFAIDGGIKFICIYDPYYYSYNSRMSPMLSISVGKTMIPPTRITNEVIGTGDGSNTKFKTSLDFPYNAEVYVNGTLVSSGVTVKKWPRTTSLLNYFQRCSNTDIDRILPTYSNEIMQNGIFYNPAHEIGIASFYSANSIYYPVYADCYISDDGENWTQIFTHQKEYNLTGAQQHAKYYKFANVQYPSGGDSPRSRMNFNSYDGNNVIFDTPPAQGDIISVSYTSDYLPKDTDHVLDIDVEFNFGEYQGE